MAQQPDSNNSVITKEMWAGIAALLLAISFWFVFHTPLTYFFFGIWGSEMLVINQFSDVLKPIKDWMALAEPSEVKFNQFFTIANEVGSYTRIFWVPALGLLAGWMLFTDKSSKFNKKYDLERLAKSFEPLWPHASMGFGYKNLKHSEPGVGNGSPLKPRELAKKYKLLDEEGELKEQEAETMLISQLGPRFISLSQWNREKHQYKLCLAALFFLKFYRKDAEFKEFRDALAFEFNNTGDISGQYVKAWEICHQYENHEDHRGRKGYFYRYLKRRHAYENTFLYAMFKLSKRGVFAPCEFRWVKTKNRTLWYTLNSVDRRVAWAEAAAIKAHWWAEFISQKAIRTPVIAEALIGLKESLKEIREKVEEDE